MDWDLEDLILEFLKTYQDDDGRQAKHDQELWISVHLQREGVSLATFHEMFLLRSKYPYIGT